MPSISIGRRQVGDGHPTYFIADIAANHDGDLGRAKRLVQLAAESGADAAKFQHFRAAEIVSDAGFRALGAQLSHQSTWQKSVVEVYADASVPWEWTPQLKAACDAHGIDFFSAAYDMDAVDMLDPYVDVYKIGSGDITWTEMLEHVAAKGKPVILSTGASDLGDVQRAVSVINRTNPQLVLLQCNTNYTGSRENLAHSHLDVLTSYRATFPEAVLGLSDHTHGNVTVLGSVALGGRVIEKHFTDDTSRAGPDHGFSMDPRSWREMVERTRDLEAALGGRQKIVAANERETVVLQRRCLRAALDLKSGTRLDRGMIDVLRPAPADGIFPYDIGRVLGLELRADVPAGTQLRWAMFKDPR